MKEYRIAFEKTGLMRYISHLDLNRCMIRAIRRSGLPAWYTEGFHPHMYLMFPLALSLGAESVCEAMDIRLTEEVPEEEILSRLNAALPEGLHATGVREPKHATIDIGSAAYTVTLAGEDLKALWEAFLAQPEIPVEKKTKKGIKTVDIKPQITCDAAEETADGLRLTLRLPAGNDGSLNVSVVTDALTAFAQRPILVRNVCRITIFCRNGEVFS